MSERDWQWPLAEAETLLWQGRPAPRCYTFRNWKLATAGTLLFLASSFWMMLAYELIDADGYPWWLVLVPLPLVLLSLWFGPVSMLLARIRWEKVFYALTDQRLLVRGGLFAAKIDFYDPDQMVDWKQKNYGEHLASLRISLQDGSAQVLHCLEQPQNLIGHLQRRMQKSAAETDSVDLPENASL